MMQSMMHDLPTQNTAPVGHLTHHYKAMRVGCVSCCRGKLNCIGTKDAKEICELQISCWGHNQLLGTQSAVGDTFIATKSAVGDTFIATTYYVRLRLVHES